MAVRPIFVVMLLATLAFAMVAESSLSSHFNDPAVSVVTRQNTDGGLQELTAGRVGDTLFEDEEMMMPSESARRTLWRRDDHISYRAMAKNAIPCDRRGASYYQCTRMQQVRPYRRGCSKITRCKRR
ncbi:protein RALF-like 19 [Lycium ferocissimum]|uniref:protein RALF-like 19 n=1 Tax=Lycium ferocissimum TaxID=112874 RepID=UPI0028166085|nr:protein RALF-like 19 [Lycium ferocissimum]